MNANNLIIADKAHLVDVTTFKKSDEEKLLAKELKKQFKAKQNGSTNKSSAVKQDESR